MLALLAPGQGAQTPGFLGPWCALPPVEARLRAWSDAVGMDLVALGTEADAATIVDTAVAQPLLVAAALAVAAELGTIRGDTAVAGHSVGEFAAAALAGVLDEQTALRLVRARGRAMAAAAAAQPSGMTALLGGDAQTVEAAIAAAGCVAANVNAAGQIVAAGTTQALARLADDPPAGARLRPLSVAGAFHTPLMAPAEEALAAAVGDVAPRTPRLPLLSNADGAVVGTGRDALDRLVRQVTRPVRWDLCMRTLRDRGVTAVIELPPAGTLAALVRRELPGVEVVALKSPDDLDRAHALLDAQPASTGHSFAWSLLVAPANGTFHPIPVQAGAPVAAGAVVATIRGRGGEHAVHAADGGVVVEWLACDGDPVSPGQPLLRLEPRTVG